MENDCREDCTPDFRALRPTRLNWMKKDATFELARAKSDRNISALADSMEFLNLGTANISKQNKFNVNAWSTPLRSIENIRKSGDSFAKTNGQSDRASFNKPPSQPLKIQVPLDITLSDDISDQYDGGLNNLSDLLPQENIFEKTNDLIECCLVFPDKSVNDETRVQNLKQSTPNLNAPLTPGTHGPSLKPLNSSLPVEESSVCLDVNPIIDSNQSNSSECVASMSAYSEENSSILHAKDGIELSEKVEDTLPCARIKELEIAKLALDASILSQGMAHVLSNDISSMDTCSNELPSSPVGELESQIIEATSPFITNEMEADSIEYALTPCQEEENPIAESYISSNAEKTDATEDYSPHAGCVKEFSDEPISTSCCDISNSFSAREDEALDVVTSHSPGSCSIDSNLGSELNCESDTIETHSEEIDDNISSADYNSSDCVQYPAIKKLTKSFFDWKSDLVDSTRESSLELNNEGLDCKEQTVTENLDCSSTENADESHVPRILSSCIVENPGFACVQSDTNFDCTTIDSDPSAFAQLSCSPSVESLSGARAVSTNNKETISDLCDGSSDIISPFSTSQHGVLSAESSEESSFDVAESSKINLSDHTSHHLSAEFGAETEFHNDHDSSSVTVVVSTCDTPTAENEPESDPSANYCDDVGSVVAYLAPGLDAEDCLSVVSDDCYEDCVTEMPFTIALSATCSPTTSPSSELLEPDQSQIRHLDVDEDEDSHMFVSICSDDLQNSDVEKCKRLVQPDKESIVDESVSEDTNDASDETATGAVSEENSITKCKRLSAADSRESFGPAAAEFLRPEIRGSEIEIDDATQILPPAKTGSQPRQSPSSRCSFGTPVKDAPNSARPPHAEKRQQSAVKLARVCDSVNKLMTLCTPMKAGCSASATPVSLFRCERLGDEGEKIVLDLPTNLLDVSIGMLENMTALMAAPSQPAAGQRCGNVDENVAMDLVSVMQTPTSNSTESSRDAGELKASLMALSEENADLKRELGEYKKTCDDLSVNYESLLKTAFALRSNETILKKALQDYEDEIRKVNNKYEILKEYANDIIMKQNKSLDSYENELKVKIEELEALKSNQ